MLKPNPFESFLNSILFASDLEGDLQGDLAGVLAGLLAGLLEPSLMVGVRLFLTGDLAGLS